MKKVILVISLVGLTLVLTAVAEAADIQAVLDEALGASAFVVQDSASTTVTSVDSDGNVVIKGGVRLDSAGTEYTTAEDLIVDGNIGVNDITPDARLDVDNTSASVDSFGITHSASASGINAAEIGFTQQDDADATDTNAAISISATSSSLDADTLLGIDIANITAGTATENAIRIGSGWDSSIRITENAVSKTKIDLASDADNAKWIAVDSGWVLSFVNDAGFKFYNSSGAGKAFGTNVMSIENSAIYMYVDPVVGSGATNRWLKMYGNILFEESDDFLGSWGAYTITLGNIQNTTTATTFQFGRTSGIDIFNFNTTATYNFKTLSSSGTDDITLDPAGNDVLPGSDNTDNLGSSAVGWKSLWINGADNAVAQTVKINVAQASVTALDTFIDFRSTTGSEGSIAGTATAGLIAYSTFTGSHWTKVDGRDGLEPNILLEATGEKFNDGKEQLVKSRICKTKKSKAIYGVYGGTDKDGNDMVLALGSGYIWVVNKGEDIEVGDYLISSDIAGCAERQQDDVLHNYTAAKALEPIKWENGETKKLIACTLHAG